MEQEEDQDLLASSADEEEEDNGEEGELQPRRSLDGVFFGAFQALDYLGRGRGGGTVFSVAHIGGHGAKAAAKWPVPLAEVDSLQELNAHPACPGVPKLLARGKIENEWYMVTEALGRPLSRVFKRIRRYPLRYRWGIVSILGRMVLQRLEGMHRKGYVHNDVKPDNILIGRPGARGAELYAPYLIDFGTTQRFSGDDKLRRDLGTVDFNSARSGRDLQRRPHDDLEALAWTMLHGLFGKLPWFSLTRQANWSDHTQRFEAVAKVQAMKERVLKEGFGFLGPEWGHLHTMPQGLMRFLALCQPTKYLDEMPKYEELAAVIGGLRYRQPDADISDVGQLRLSLREGRERRLDMDFPDGEAEIAKMDEKLSWAARQEAAKLSVMANDLERMGDMVVWEVVGGEDRGGIVVRKGIERDSQALPMRLATGALVEEETLEGERLAFNKLIGDGPNCGWVSIRIKYGDVVKQLMAPHELTHEEFQRVKAAEILLASA
mmetsp:Transcript_38723/g.120999  ORF Transcript_38723/g.120999 Transcript_38723/m.120999 type:complete len:491 (-) Transcript_38723:11-1483(-)